MRVSQKNITELNPNEIFVFGSNLNGIHAGGAARLAQEKFGAIAGLGNGRQGNCYAIPTISRSWGQLQLKQIETFVNEFIYFANAHPKISFLVTEIGCGISGYDPKDIAPLFNNAPKEENIYLPERFLEILNVPSHA